MAVDDVQGVVTDSDGNPVQGATVYALRTDSSPPVVAGEDTTNSSGEYQITTDFAGEVHVVAEWDSSGTKYSSDSSPFIEVLGSVPDSAVAQWVFGEGSGSTAGDDIGNNDLSVNGTTWVSDSWAGQSALDGDGVDDIAENNSLSGNLASLGSTRGEAMTVSMTIQTTDNSHTFFNCHVAGNAFAGVHFGLGEWPAAGTNGGEINFGYRGDDSTNYVYVKTDNTFNDGKKHRVTGVIDGPYSGPSDLSIYVDGVDQSVTTVQDTSPQTTSNFSECVLFALENGTQHCDITLDNVIISNQVWTPSQISSDFQRQPWS